MTYDPIVKRLANNITKISLASSMQQYGNISNSVGCSFHEDMVERYDLLSANASWKSFINCSFDGRYVYYIPFQDTSAAVSLIRYDTSLPLAETASWSSVSLSSFDSSWIGYGAAIFDGKYLYMIPYGVTFGGTSIATSTVLRYDTNQSFDSTSSWTGYTLTAVNTLWSGFTSAVFDGKYLYMMASNDGDLIWKGIVVRYDTTLPFNSTASWTSYAVSSHGTDCIGLSSAIFDGRYVYTISIFNGTDRTGTLIRYDTTKAFSSTASWTALNLTSFNVKWRGFYNIVFDSQYVYMIPFLYTGLSSNSTFVRYDTNKPFTSSSSYESFDISTINATYSGYHAGVYDGRYLYAIPYYSYGVGFHGNIARYDTTKSFNSTASWTVFDLASSNPTYVGFRASCFDGRDIYLVPLSNGTASGTICRVRVKPFNVFQEYQL